jgi:hypothetical protein
MPKDSLFPVDEPVDFKVRNKHGKAVLIRIVEE